MFNAELTESDYITLEWTFSGSSQNCKLFVTMCSLLVQVYTGCDDFVKSLFELVCFNLLLSVQFLFLLLMGSWQ